MGFLTYFKGVSYKDGQLHIAHTGAKIAVDRVFLRDAGTIIKINSYIAAARLGQKLRGRGQPTSLAFYPQPAGPWYNGWLAAKMAGFKVTRDITHADYVFIFDDKTLSKPDGKWPDTAINVGITDISKHYVGQVFKRVFGYDLSVNPLLYQGAMVEKSDENAAHDGRVVQGPLAVHALRQGSVYQKLVDSTALGPRSEDLRVIYVMGKIAIVFHKFKHLEKRFGTDYDQVDIRETDDVFSQAEQASIIKFCRAMGLDFGALDVLRDKHDGRIYIVDVNKTGMPVLSLRLRDQVIAFRKISTQLRRGLSLAPDIY